MPACNKELLDVRCLGNYLVEGEVLAMEWCVNTSRVMQGHTARDWYSVQRETHESLNVEVVEGERQAIPISASD